MLARYGTLKNFYTTLNGVSSKPLIYYTLFNYVISNMKSYSAFQQHGGTFQNHF